MFDRWYITQQTFPELINRNAIQLEPGGHSGGKQERMLPLLLLMPN